MDGRGPDAQVDPEAPQTDPGARAGLDIATIGLLVFFIALIVIVAALLLLPLLNG